MKKLALIVCLLASVSYAQQLVNTTTLPTVIQKRASASSGSVASLALAYSNNTTQGNSLVVAFCNGNVNAPTAPISDTLSNSWKLAVHQVQGSALECDIWYATPNATGGANTVTVTPGGSNASIAMEIYEISGMITQSTAQPAWSASNSGSSGTASAGSVSPATSNEFTIAAVGIGTAAQTITPASGWTNDSGQQNPTTPAGLFSFVAFSRFSGDLQRFIPSATFTSEPWAISVAGFRPLIFPIQATVKVIDGSGDQMPTGDTAARAIHVTSDNGQQVTVTTATTTDTASRCSVQSGTGTTASTNATNCKGSAGNVYGFRAINTSTTIAYLRMYNSSSSPTCSSSTGFIESIPIPPAGSSGQAGGVVQTEEFGEGYTTGIGFCVTGGGGNTDNTNSPAGVYITVLYK